MDPAPESVAEQHVHLLNDPPGRAERRIAWVVVVVSALFFLVVLPNATLQIGRHEAFVPVYVTSLIISDLITAVMLYGQYYALRTRGLLILAAGYLYTAAATLGFALVFPGLLAPAGLLGAGPQSTSAMYMFWHAGFPLVVIGYAWFKRHPAPPVPAERLRKARHAIGVSVAIVLAVVGACITMVVLGHDHLPVVMDGNTVTGGGWWWLFGVWLLSGVALLALWFSKPHTTLDIWLLVVMCVWVFDIALAAVMNAGRYDLGWYAGRAYGFVGAGLLLVMLLSEHARSYAQLVRVSAELHHANDLLWQDSMHDSLTQLANRRAFDKYLQEQMALAARQCHSLALVMIDVDHFKAYNDLYGHMAGDRCLQEVADVLAASCRRPSDMVARYGGEEFVMVLPDTDKDGAMHVAEELRAAVWASTMPHKRNSAGPYVSVSVGVSAVRPGDSIGVAPLVVAADAALYRAKNGGRNQVVYVEVASEAAGGSKDKAAAAAPTPSRQG